MTEDEDIIKRLAIHLGKEDKPDYTRLAAVLSDMAGWRIDRDRMYMWRQRNSVPWRYRTMVALLATRLGVAVPANFFDIAPRRAGK